MALLLLLRDAAPETGCEVRAAHVHHHVRFGAADGDAEFCAELCARLGVPLQVRHVATRRGVGVSPEAFMRAERYRLLDAARIAMGCAAVATGHTRDDQAETVLLALLRGGGVRRLGGIRPRTPGVIRPLLEEPREALRHLLASSGQSWREDETNADPTQPRAAVRAELLPLIEARFPRSGEHLAAVATRLAEDDELLSELLVVRAVWPEIGLPIRVEVVRDLPTALRRRWVLGLAERLPLAEAPSRTQVDLVERLLAGEEPAAVDLGAHWVLHRRGERLLLDPPPCPRFAPVPAAVGESVTLPGGFRCSLGEAAREHDAVTHHVMLNPDRLQHGATWRPLQAGETTPDRGNARKALARLGVPTQWRHAWPVLEAGGRMIWLPGVAVAPGCAGEPMRGVPALVEEPWIRPER